MTVLVTFLELSEHSEWDAFVTSSPDGTFCHLSGWKTAIEQGAGQKCPYLIARRGGVVVGVLPLTIKRHFLFGKALISNMFCVYGGALGVDADVVSSLYDRAWEFAQREGLPAFEVRGNAASEAEEANWITSNESATFIRTLADNDDDQLLAIPRKQRAVIRKSLKNAMTTQWEGDLEVFYDLYAQSVLSLGTPVFPTKLFQVLKSEFADAVQVQLTLSAEGKPVASLMSFYFNGTVMPYYAGGTSEVRRFGAHDFMYFNLMLHARERGCTHFDFGRSKIDSGPYKFKKNWGFEPSPLSYCTRLMPGAKQPNVSQQSGPYATMSNVWKKLPLGLSKTLGPSLARHLG